MFNSVPDNYNANLAVCAAHFTEDSFQNLHEFNAGFAQRLLLKDEAVPTLKAEAAVYGPQTVSMFYCMYMSLKCIVLLLFFGCIKDVNKDQRGLASLAS